MSEIITIGLDLAKNVFQAHGADVSGRAVLRKSIRPVCPRLIYFAVKFQGIPPAGAVWPRVMGQF
jgi:hypothetical protein